MIEMLPHCVSKPIEPFGAQVIHQPLMMIATASLLPGRAPGSNYQRRTLRQAHDQIGQHLITGNRLQLNMKRGGEADRRRTIWLGAPAVRLAAALPAPPDAAADQ